jgi:hypothetical protein
LLHPFSFAISPIKTALPSHFIYILTAKEAKESDSRSYDFELEAKRSRKILRPCCTGKRLEVLLCREKVEVPLYWDKALDATVQGNG